MNSKNVWTTHPSPSTRKNIELNWINCGAHARGPVPCRCLRPHAPAREGGGAGPRAWGPQWTPMDPPTWIQSSIHGPQFRWVILRTFWRVPALRLFDGDVGHTGRLDGRGDGGGKLKMSPAVRRPWPDAVERGRFRIGIVWNFFQLKIASRFRCFPSRKISPSNPCILLPSCCVKNPNKRWRTVKIGKTLWKKLKVENKKSSTKWKFGLLFKVKLNRFINILQKISISLPSEDVSPWDSECRPPGAKCDDDREPHTEI